MITVYIQIDGPLNEVVNISLSQLRNNYIKAILEDTTIDLAKLNHYTLRKNNDEDIPRLVLDEEHYANIMAEKAKTEALKEGTKKLEELQYETALRTASDTDAYTMRYLYNPWEKDTEYLVGDRVRYNDNLYRCKQKHVSQEQHTPDLIPAIWDIVNPDDSKGTLDNPILIPDNFSSMVYVKGKYYLEDGKIYLMNRTGMNEGEEISLTFKPSQLINQYFKLVEE